MWFSTVVLFLAATACQAQDLGTSLNGGSAIESSQVTGEREPFFFVTLTVTLTSTISLATTTTLSTASTCTSLSSTTACSGKRRRRGIMMNDEEYFEDKIIRPSAVNAVEATAAPAMPEEPKREAREAQFYDNNNYNYYNNPILPTFGQVPYSPRYNPYVAAMSPYFRQGAPVPNVYQPDQRFLFSFATTTSTSFTTTTTSTTFTTTVTQVLLCSAASSFSACASG